MRRVITPLLAVMFLLGVATLARADTIKYVCNPCDYPDGTEGVAIVKVIMSETAAGPTVMVTVDYYNLDQSQYLGRYEDWSSSGNFPQDEYEAADFATHHYFDRW